MVQVVWDKENKETLARETRALRQAEQELGFRGKLLDYKDYLQYFIKDINLRSY